MSSILRRHGALLGLLVLLALVFTWPLVARIFTHVPGSDTWAYDEYTFIWSMWWFKHSLLDGVGSIFFSPNIFYPLGMELILYSYNLMAAILALPLGLASENWAFASNISLLFSIVISGYGAYLLALWTLAGAGANGREGEGARGRMGEGQARAAALVAAIIFAFASNRMIYLALGHYNIHSVHWLPFFTLYVLRVMRRPTRHDAIMMGLFGALNLLVDMQYGVFMAFLALCLLLTRPLNRLLFQKETAGKRWLALIGGGLVALLLTLPYFWETVRAFLHADFLISGWGDALKLSADLKGWFTPTALHPLWGADWVRRLREVQEGTAPFNDVNTVFLGYVTVILAGVGAVAIWRRMRGWVMAAILSASFTLGPLLQVGGRYYFNFDGLETGVPMPFLILHYIPFVKGNRTANRWSIVLMLALAVLAAWGAAWILRRWRPRASIRAGVTLALAGLLLFEHAAMPLPQTDARIPPAIQRLAEMEPGAILPIPMGWRNSFGVLGVERTQAQYYMTAHEMPILSGNTSRNPAIKFDYFARLPLVQAIVQQETGSTPDEATLAAARDQVDDLIALWGVRYLMLLPPVPGRLPYADTWRASQQLALDLIPHSPEPIIDDGSIQIYAVNPAPPLPLELDFGAMNTDAWRGAGWGTDEPDVGGANGVWATARRAQIVFRSEDAAPRALRFRALPFTWPDADEQRLTIRLNGDTVASLALPPGWNEYEHRIAPRPGLNQLWFEFERADSPRDRLGQAMIAATGVQSPVNIEIHAFEQAFITLQNADGTTTDASFGRRGYNVTVLDPKSGEVLDEQGFDTVANAYEVERLVRYLNELPQGRIVLLATREGAGDFVSDELVAALQRLGSAISSPAQLKGQAHAFAGVAAAAPGTAAETLDPADAYLAISGDFRTLAAAFDWLTIE
ncbi:MAG: hypothetical protein GXP42_05320 [Chloroflexi bacterium]|nr:hypothetical protein [Chloroflexota bacterium]